MPHDHVYLLLSQLARLRLHSGEIDKLLIIASNGFSMTFESFFFSRIFQEFTPLNIVVLKKKFTSKPKFYIPKSIVKMHISIDEIANRSSLRHVLFTSHHVTFSLFTDKDLEADLKAFGIESDIESKLTTTHPCDEWYRFASEIRLSDVQVDVHKLQSHHKKLTEDILKSQQSIKALKE